MKRLAISMGLCALLSTVTSHAAETAEPMGYAKDEAAIAGIANYIGLSTFCEKYNYAFPEMAGLLQSKMNQHPALRRASADRKTKLNRVFIDSRERGEQGYVYVPSKDAFQNSAQPGTTMESVCLLANASAKALAKRLQ